MAKQNFVSSIISYVMHTFKNCSEVFNISRLIILLLSCIPQNMEFLLYLPIKFNVS